MQSINFAENFLEIPTMFVLVEYFVFQLHQYFFSQRHHGMCAENDCFF